MAHFLLGMVFLADAVVLHYRAGLADQPQAGRRPPPPACRRGPPGRGPGSRCCWPGSSWPPPPWPSPSGPLSRPPDRTAATRTHRRFHFSLHSVAQLHGTSVEVLLAVTLLTMWSLARTHAPAAVMRARRDRAGRHGRPGRPSATPSTSTEIPSAWSPSTSPAPACWWWPSCGSTSGWPAYPAARPRQHPAGPRRRSPALPSTPTT